MSGDLIVAGGNPDGPASWNPERSSSGKQVVNLESRFFGWGLESTLNVLLHAWNKSAVAEPFPTVQRVVGIVTNRERAPGRGCLDASPDELER